MTDEPKNFREERIEKLLTELQHEICRGLSQHEIGEHMGFEFIFPISRAIPNGMVHCSFRMAPVPDYFMIDPRFREPRLKVVK